MRDQSYGDRLSAHWDGSSPLSALVNNSFGHQVTAARIVGDAGFGFVDPVPAQDGYAVSLELKDFRKGEIWLDGRSRRQIDLNRNNTVLYDLRHHIEAKLDDAFDFVHFHVPRAYLTRMAREHGLQGFSELSFRDGVGFHDAVILSLAQMLLPAFERTREANQLFIDHCILALCAHLLGSLGNLPVATKPAPGLTPRRLKRAKEMLDAHIDGTLQVADIAKAVDLTPSYFAKQFAKSTGLAPHQWLLRRRVDRAKALMSTSNSSLADVALACGFADQSHLTRVFRQIVGITPSAWRRTRDV